MLELLEIVKDQYRVLNFKYTKIILFILIIFGWTNLALAEIFVLNKCWSPIEKNAYGDKVKNFKEFKKIKEIEDHIIKINAEKMTIIKRYVLAGEKDYYDPYHPRVNLIKFKISNFKDNIIVGTNKFKKILKPEDGNRMITVDLNNRKAAIWYSKQNQKTIKFKISCKVYKESDNSTLKSILKMLN